MANYDVGYKKPPREYQFQKGESGNPSGRPRKVALEKDVHNLLEEFLNQKTTVTIGKRKRRVTFLQAAALKNASSLINNPNRFYDLLELANYLKRNS